MSGNSDGKPIAQPTVHGGSNSTTRQYPAEFPLTREAQDVIARKLRETYDSKLSEPIPDKFGKLLDLLAKKG